VQDVERLFLKKADSVQDAGGNLLFCLNIVVRFVLTRFIQQMPILQTVKTAPDENFILSPGSVFFDIRGSCVNCFLNSSMQGIRVLKK
jgi:hypothetical protein